jgi:hypothetical protein
LDKRRQFQSQARAVTHRTSRMMMSNHLNAVGRSHRAVAMMKAKTIAPPRPNKIDIATFHFRCLVSSSSPIGRIRPVADQTDSPGGEFDVAVMVTAN